MENDIIETKTKTWFLAYSPNANGATLLQSTFNRLGRPDVLLWVPTYKVQDVYYGKIKTVDAEIFPGYVFVNCHAEDVYSLDQSLFEARVGYFLKKENTPIPITQDEIAHVQSLSTSHTTEEPLPVVEVGTMVEISSGPFMGFRGVVIGIMGSGVIVETFVFGRSSSVQVPAKSLVQTRSEEVSNG